MSGDEQEPPALLGAPAVAGMEVRRVHPYQALRPYRCPGCGNAIAVGEGHTVAWATGDPEGRRHWHRHCWRHHANADREGAAR